MTAQVQERLYFPAPDVVLHDNGIRMESYRRGDTEVKVSYIPPGAVIASRSHQAGQVGMVIRGELSMTVGDVTKLMKPEHDVCIVPPHVAHSAVNTSSGEAIALEIMRDKPGETYTGPSGFFLEPLESRKFVEMDVTFFLADWVELMIAYIPSGGEMPYHKHRHEQIGVCLEGRYDMTVEGASHELAFSSTYFCESYEGHGAANPNAGAARSLNIFIPPRYHRVPKREAR